MGIYIIDKHLKKALLLVSITGFLLGFVPPTYAQSLSEEGYYDLILEVKRNKRETLSSAILGIEKQGRYYLPLQELARIVRFQAHVDIDQETIDGFLFTEENTYSVDAKNHTFTIRGKTTDFSPEHILVLKQGLGIGDIYATTELINQIWPLEIELDLLQQKLDIKTKRELPYQMAKERQRKRSKRLNRIEQRELNNPSIGGLTRIENKYKIFSLPVLNISATSRWEKQNSGLGQSITIGGKNDLLNMQADYRFSFDKDPRQDFGFENARFLLERKTDADNDLPLGLNLFQLGDVRPKPSRLIDGSLRGRGFLFSTEPQKQLRDFDQITVEGTAEPGWEVELYRGDELVDFQIVDDQGEYRFENVSLNFNKTVIRTILYGPEGQIKESEKEYNISTSMIQPGKTVFEASVLDSDRDLILTDNRPSNRVDGIAQNYRVKQGILPWLSGFSTLTDMPTRNGDKRYATLGFNLSLFGASSVIEAYKEFGGGHGFDFRVANNFYGTNLNLRTSFLSNFESEHIGFNNTATTAEIDFSANRSFKLSYGTLGLRFQMDHEQFKDADDQTEFDFTQTFSKSGLRITHGNQINLVDRRHQLSTGRINSTYRINPNWQLRSLLNYQFFPDRELRNTLAELRYKDGDKFTAAVDIDRNFLNDTTRYGVQASYDFDTVRTGVNVDWDKDSGFRTFLRTSLSLAPYGYDGGYIAQSKNMSSKAALVGRIYHDKNRNNQFDREDRMLKDAQILVGKRDSDLSNIYGMARHIGSPKYDPQDILLSHESLDNPFMLSANAGYKALLRPSTVTHVDFPVIEAGIIDGKVYTDDGPVVGLRLELLSENEIIDTTTTAFDGYYTFENVEVGHYVVRVDPQYEQIEYIAKDVAIRSKDLLQYDVDFYIQAKQEIESEEVLPKTSSADIDDGRNRITNQFPIVSKYVRP